jgi:hypothetical protein
MQPKRRQLSTQQWIGLALFMFTGPILALNYWENGDRSTYFGALPFNTLVLIATIGGAVAFPVYVGTGRRLLALIPGALAGFGAFELHVFWTTWQQKEFMHSGESLVIAAVGASPGILLCWGLMRLLARNGKEDDR